MDYWKKKGINTGKSRSQDRQSSNRSTSNSASAPASSSTNLVAAAVEAMISELETSTNMMSAAIAASSDVPLQLENPDEPGCSGIGLRGWLSEGPGAGSLFSLDDNNGPSTSGTSNDRQPVVANESQDGQGTVDALHPNRVVYPIPNNQNLMNVFDVDHELLGDYLRHQQEHPGGSSAINLGPGGFAANQRWKAYAASMGRSVNPIVHRKQLAGQGRSVLDDDDDLSDDTSSEEGEAVLNPVGQAARSQSAAPAAAMHAQVEETERPVNILPASRNLDLPVHNIIAIGRRPLSSAAKTAPRLNPPTTNTLGLGWQASKLSVKDRMQYMYLNDLLADVYFIVGREDPKETSVLQRIPAHIFVLSIGSAVFDAMFNGGLTPKSSDGPLEIELPDVEPAAFLTLLKFLYTDEVNIGPESVMTTLYTAKKYAVPAMEQTCVEFLKQSLGADNAFMLLTQARLFDEPQLEQLCLELIDKKTVDALNGEGFIDIDRETLCVVLARDTLRVKESLLFQAVIRWSKEECVRRKMEPTTESKRSVLGNALQLIRFPLMTVEEFAQNAAQSGLLSDREVVELFLYHTATPKPDIPFSCRPRCAFTGKELVVARFQRYEVRWGYSGVPDRIKFTVDKKIYVAGFGLFGGTCGPQEYSSLIQILHCGTGKVLAQNETSFICDGSSGTFRVMFKEPVEITANVTYIASAFLKGPDTHYGTKGLRRIVHQSAAGTVTFQFTFAAGNNNGTSVEDGQIPEIIFYTKVN